MKIKKVQLILESKNTCYVEQTEAESGLYFYSWANNPSMNDVKELTSKEKEIRRLFN